MFLSAQSYSEESHVHLLKSPAMDQEKMRPVGVFS